MPTDPRWQALKDEWDRHIETHSVMLTGGAHRTVCPLCKEDHQVCVFQSGGLYCVMLDCGNPHHRDRDSRPVIDAPPF